MNTIKLASLGALLLLTVAPARAADTYAADPAHTSVRVCWSHFGVSRQCAYFRAPDAQLVYDQAKPENSSLNVSFKIDNVESLVPAFNEHLKGEQWFDAKKFPTATFKSTKVEKTGDKTGKVIGDLTVKGVTKPVTLDVTLNFAGQHPYPNAGRSLGFTATSELKRSDYGLGAYAPAVSDAVTLEVSTEFNAAEKKS